MYHFSCFKKFYINYKKPDKNQHFQVGIVQKRPRPVSSNVEFLGTNERRFQNEIFYVPIYKRENH